MRWNNAAGARPGLSRTTLRYLRRLLNLPVLHRVVVGLADGVLLEAVPLNPAVLVGAPELRPELRAEPVEQVKERARIATCQSSCQGEGAAAGVGEDARCDALGGASSFVFVHLVCYEELEEPLHPLLDVVREWISLRPLGVGLPQGGAAPRAGAPLAPHLLGGEGHTVLVHDLAGADRAAGDPEGLPRLLVPDEPAPGCGPPLDVCRLPAVGELRPFPGHDGEEGAWAGGEAQFLQVGDGGDDGGAGLGHRLLHFPLPLPGQVRGCEYEGALETRSVGCGCAE